MPSLNTIRRVTVEGRTSGLSQVVTELRGVTKAQEEVARSSETTARVTETSARRQGSVAQQYERQKRSLDDAAKAQYAFERGQNVVNRALQQGVIGLAEQERALARLRDAYQSAGTRRAPTVDQSGINSLLGVREAQSGAARASAAAFEEAARETDQMAAKANTLRAALDPVVAAQQRLNAEMVEYSTLAAHGAITTGELAQAHNMAKARFDAVVPPVDDLGKKTGLAAHQMTNLGYQVNDVATMLLSGSSPFQVMATQGGQVYQILGSAPGGIGAAMRSIGSAALGLAGKLAPFAAVAGLGAVAVATLQSRINKASKESVSFGDTFKAVFQTIGDGIASLWKSLGNSAIAEWFSDQWDVVIKGFGIAYNVMARGAANLANHIGGAIANIPDAFRVMAEDAGNGFVSGIRDMLNEAIKSINSFLQYLRGVPVVNLAVPDDFSPLTTGRIDLGGAGASQRMAARNVATAAEADRIQDTDYASKHMAQISAHAIKNAHEDDKKKKGGRQPRQSDYDREIESLQDRTAAMEADTRAVGLSTFEAAKLTAQMDLENAARKDAIGLSPARVAQIEKEATAYANQSLALEKAREALQRLDDVRDAYREGMSTFVSEFRDGLKSGEGFWTSFANAAVAALDRITERLMDLALNSAMDALLGKQGTSGTGLLGGLLGSFFGGGSSSPISLGTPGGTAGGLTPIHHTGGIVGFDNATSRYVHPAYFDDAPKFHTGGIVGDEVPIVAKRGEGVFTQAQMRALGGGGGMNVKVVNNMGGQAQVTPQQEDDGSMTLFVDAMEGHMAGRAASGRGPLSQMTRVRLKG